MNNVDDKDIRSRVPGRLIGAAVPFLVLFVAFLVHVLLKDGYAYNDAGYIYMEPNKYLTNFIDMWYLLVVLLIGVVLVLYGIGKTIFSKGYIGGIWPAGIGTVLTVLALLLSCAWNHTASSWAFSGCGSMPSPCCQTSMACSKRPRSYRALPSSAISSAVFSFLNLSN